MCIKCGKLKNKKFIFLFALFILIRKIILILLKKFCNFEGTLITTWLMFAGELFIGFCNLFIEYKRLLNINIERFLSIPIRPNKPETTHHNKYIKVLLFLFCTLLDFGYYFFLIYYVTKKYSEDLLLLDIKLFSFILIFTSIISLFIISNKIRYIQIISTFFIFISLIGIIIFEFLFKKNLNNNDETKLLIFIIGSYIFSSMQCCVEKYLMEYDNSTPFQILFYEGIFGNIIMIIVSFFKFENKFSNKNPIDNIVILVFGLILYFFCCCFLNIYKLTVMHSSSPMNVATSQSLIVPFILILYFYINNSEIDKFNNIWIYILTNFIAIIIIILCCLLFNEIIVIKCKRGDKNYDNKNIKINDSLNVSQNGLGGTFTTEGDDSF